MSALTFDAVLSVVTSRCSSLPSASAAEITLFFRMQPLRQSNAFITRFNVPVPVRLLRNSRIVFSSGVNQHPILTLYRRPILPPLERSSPGAAESPCKARSTYYARAAIARDPDLASIRAWRDRENSVRVQHVFDTSGGRYGARKVWHALRREGHDVARCTVERLMKAMGLQGVVRAK